MTPSYVAPDGRILSQTCISVANPTCAPEPAAPAVPAAAPVPAAAVGIPPVTIADLVNFDPTAGSHGMEPNGWSIIDLEANFFVTAGVHVQEGELVGLPASVRFTPVAYRWDYGDGTSAVLRQPGSPWATVGAAEFDSTSTSHAFADAGRFTVTLTVDFAAEYTFDGSAWTPIDGLVPVAADSITATVSDASTLLVGADCSARAAAIGC